MATLIPALGSCTARMTAGERRLAQRLEDKLDGDSTLQTDPHTSKKNGTPLPLPAGARAPAPLPHSHPAILACLGAPPLPHPAPSP